MKKNQAILLFLSCTLAIGVFLPLVTAPIIGPINYFRNGHGDGKFILLCALIAAILSLSKYIKLVVIPGFVATLLLGMFFLDYQDAISEFNRIDTSDMGPFSSLGETMKSSFSITYGFIVMFIAALALTFLPFPLTQNSTLNE